MKKIAYIFLFIFIFFPTALLAVDFIDPNSSNPCGGGGITEDIQRGNEFRPCLLAPLPTGAANEASPTFTEYLTFVYRFLIAGTALVATGQIVYAGILRIWGGVSQSSITKSREIIERSLWGLGLALSSYLILYTINPSLAEIKLEIPPIVWKVQKFEPVEKGPTQGSVLSGENISSSEEATRKYILSKGVTIVSSGNNSGVVDACPDGEKFFDYKERTGRSCTSVRGLATSTIDKIGNLKKDCNCSVAISGGTEEGHQTHGPNHPSTLDLEKGLNFDNLEKYIKENSSAICTKKIKKKIKQEDGTEKEVEVEIKSYVTDGIKFTDEDNHWHVLVGGRCY